jgi:hypothetical protein
MTLISTPMLSEKPTLFGTLSESSPTQLLTCCEQFWAESYEFLLSHGYQLRPRYHPEWVPSWGPKRNPIGRECDDFLTSYKTNTLDALCIKDNQKVVLKRVNGKELKIFRLLDALRSDARNHTIPLLDVIPFPGTEWTFVVMPYCRRFNSPLFHCQDEFIDAMTQYIEVSLIQCALYPFTERPSRGYSSCMNIMLYTCPSNASVSFYRPIERKCPLLLQ